MQAERHDLIVPVVPDVGAAQPGDSIALAPVARNRFGLDAEGPVILGNVADPHQSQSRQPAPGKDAGDMEEQTVEGIEIFADLLDTQNMSRHIRLEGGAEPNLKRNQVERGVARAVLQTS